MVVENASNQRHRGQAKHGDRQEDLDQGVAGVVAVTAPVQPPGHPAPRAPPAHRPVHGRSIPNVIASSPVPTILACSHDGDAAHTIAVPVFVAPVSL